MFAGRAIEYKEKPVPAGLGQKLALLALEFRVEEDRRLDRVPVVYIVRRRLKMPHQFAGIRIKRNDRAGEEIVARATFPCEHGVRVACTPIEKVEVGVVSPRHPGHTAAVENRVAVFGPRFRSRLAWGRLGVPAPLDLPRFGIKRFEKTRYIRNISGNANDNVIAYDQRRHRREILEFRIGKLNDP